MPTNKKLGQKLLKLVKRCVKERDNYTCQRCGRAGLEGFDCQASHVIPVSGGNQFKYDDLNMKVLCPACHHWWGTNPDAAKEWFKERWPDRHRYLFDQIRRSVKFTQQELLDMIAKYS